MEVKSLMTTICNNVEPHTTACLDTLSAVFQTTVSALFVPENASELLAPVQARGTGLIPATSLGL